MAGALPLADAVHEHLGPREGARHLFDRDRYQPEQAERRGVRRLALPEGGPVAHGQNGLRKVAEGLGISTRLEYISVGAVAFYWHVKAIASYVGVDGKRVEREASMEWDLRDGSPRLKGWTMKQIEEARKYGLRACETCAINAAIRECGAGLKQAYTRDELAPLRRGARRPAAGHVRSGHQAHRHRALRRRRPALYASNPVPSPADPWADHDEPRRGRWARAQPARPFHLPRPARPRRGSAAPTADQPPTPDAVRIVDIKTSTGEKNGRKWTRFAITDSRGEEHSTFSKSIADAAEKAKTERAWVEVVTITSEDGRYKNLEEIIPAGSEPELPGMENL